MYEEEVTYEENNDSNNGFGTPPYPLKKQIALFAVGWGGFKVLAILIELIVLAIFSINSDLTYSELLRQMSVSMAINSSCYICLLAILLLISSRDAFKLVDSFKRYQSYLAGIGCVVAIFAFNYAYSIFLALIKAGVTDNANETSINSITTSYPILSLIVFGLIGPVCEELTYRVGLFSLCRRKSRVLAYCVTAVVFAFIHFNFSTTSLVNELLNLPFYAFAALAFSFTYEKYGFAGSATAHMLNNIWSLLSTIILYYR